MASPPVHRTRPLTSSRRSRAGVTYTRLVGHATDDGTLLTPAHHLSSPDVAVGTKVVRLVPSIIAQERLDAYMDLLADQLPEVGQ